MIAGPHRHYDPDTLRQLLDEDLPGSQATLVEQHVAECAQCRNELEQLAGAQPWWDETVDVLGESTIAPTRHHVRDGDFDNGDDPLDPSLDWIRPLLSDDEIPSSKADPTPYVFTAHCMIVT